MLLAGWLGDDGAPGSWLGSLGREAEMWHGGVSRLSC